jgi:hypothetical protein
MSETPHTSDFGPSVRLRRDGRLISRGPGEVVIEDRDISGASLNPARRNAAQVVRGARRRDALAELKSRGTITKAQHDAGIQFLDDCSLALGPSAVSNMSGIVVQGSSREDLPERQRKAIGRVRRTIAELGLNTDTVLWWVLFRSASLAEYETAYGLKHGTASTWIKAALTALAEHYNPAITRNA